MNRPPKTGKKTQFATDCRGCGKRVKIVLPIRLIADDMTAKHIRCNTCGTITAAKDNEPIQ